MFFLPSPQEGGDKHVGNKEQGGCAKQNPGSYCKHLDFLGNF